MIFIFGTRLFGKVDEVPGYFHVATEFFHFDYLPLFPVKSWIVTSQDSGRWNGVEIPICRKSMMLAWSRAGAIVCAIIALIMAAVEPNDSTQLTAIITTTMAVLAILYTYKSKSFNHASFERACELARLANIPERTIQRYFDEVGMDTSATTDEEEEPQSESGSAHFNSTEASPATFFVSGKNKASDDVCITIWAWNEVEARQQAIAKGIDVSAVD